MARFNYDDISTPNVKVKYSKEPKYQLRPKDPVNELEENRADDKLQGVLNNISLNLGKIASEQKASQEKLYLLEQKIQEVALEQETFLERGKSENFEAKLSEIRLRLEEIALEQKTILEAFNSKEHIETQPMGEATSAAVSHGGVPLEDPTKKWLRIAAVSTKVLSAVCENLENIVELFVKTGRQSYNISDRNYVNENKVDLYELLNMFIKELSETKADENSLEN